MATKDTEMTEEKEEAKKIVVPKGIDVSKPKSDEKSSEGKKESESKLHSDTEEMNGVDHQQEDSESPINDLKMPLSSPVKPVEPEEETTDDTNSKESEATNPDNTPTTTPSVTPLEAEPVSSANQTEVAEEETVVVPETPQTSDSAASEPEAEKTDDEVKKYADTYPLADEVEQEALKKSNGGFFSKLIRLKNKKVRWVIGILALLLLVVLGVGTFLNSRGNNLLTKDKKDEKSLETIIPSPTQKITPTPIEVDRSSLIIQVLNGSGESGVAGIMSDLLIEKGYSEDIDTGNADNYDYEQTVIQIKKEKEEEFLDTILDDLKKDYSLSSEIETLEDDSEFDVVIIVGKE